jgi:ketosteroid isomerase-like protein
MAKAEPTSTNGQARAAVGQSRPTQVEARLLTPPASTALEAFKKYTESFTSQDPKAIPAHYCEPALMVTPQGVQSLPGAAAVEQAYARIMADLPKLNYARTEFTSLREQVLSDDLVMITGWGTWIDQDGKPFMPFGLTYTLRKTTAGWKIVVALIHGADAYQPSRSRPNDKLH